MYVHALTPSRQLPPSSFTLQNYHAKSPNTHTHCVHTQQCRNADRKRLADVAVLDLDSFTWRRPATSGPAPSPREGAAATYHAGHMVLFGERAGLCQAHTCITAKLAALLGRRAGTCRAAGMHSCRLQSTMVMLSLDQTTCVLLRVDGRTQAAVRLPGARMTC